MVINDFDGQLKSHEKAALSLLARESSVCTVYCITTDVLWCTVHVGYVTAHITFARRKHENQGGRFFMSQLRL